ncbi:MAG: hypothetical protein QXH42_06850 [Thermoplasmata archaeon]
MKGRRLQRAVALMALMGLTALTLLLTTVSAAPKLVVYELRVEPEPSIQGPDLPIVVTARVGCGGACCYVVYGREMKAELILPENFTLVDGDRVQWLTSPGHPQGTVAAQPGGGLTWITPRWEVRGSSLGTYNLSVRVTGTNDAGDSINVTSSAEVTIASGAAISSPVFPHRPVVGRETVLLVSVSSRRGVGSVTLFYSADNRTWRSAPMEPVGGELYRGSLPPSERETSYMIYMESVDTAGETFRTGLYTVRVRDPERAAGVSSAATLIVAAGSLAGLFLILYFGTRTPLHVRARGIFLVGSRAMEEVPRDREGLRAAQRRLVALRWRVLAILVAVMIVLFLISLLTGQLERVVSHTTNPQEAVIRWW